MINCLFIGDLVGKAGLSLFQKWAPILREKYKTHCIIVNGENVFKNGMGISDKDYFALKAAGADIITTGNHAFDQQSIYPILKEKDDILRPINYSSDCPGKGYSIFRKNNVNVAFVNLHGKVFIRDNLECPFRAIDSLLTLLRTKTKLIFVDFHAEATSEKIVMGLYLDGKVSGIYGTHTHVQTADEQIFSKGTSYMTDLGCCGALRSAIGMEWQSVYKRMSLHHRFAKFNVDTKGPFVLCGALVQADEETGKSVSIKRIRIIDNDLIIS